MHIFYVFRYIQFFISNIKKFYFKNLHCYKIHVVQTEIYYPILLKIQVLFQNVIPKKKKFNV